MFWNASNDKSTFSFPNSSLYSLSIVASVTCLG